MADYPGSIPSFTTISATDKQNAPSHSTRHNSEAGEIVAICTALGTNPQGAYTNVNDRITALEGSVGVLDWTRTGTTLTPFNVGDDVDLGTGDYYGEMLNLTNGTFTLTIDPTALGSDRNVAAEDLYQASQLYHAAVTVTDSASVDFTLTGQDITAVVLPAGVDHDLLSNFVANEHIDHTTVSISAGTGLTGGGDISANRTISLSHLGIQSLVDPDADRIIFWDDSAGATAWLVPNTGLGITNLNLDVTADYSVISANDANTDVTGTELETLTDGSNADLLHTHTGLAITHSLDDAYDDGSTITVDTGAVTLNSSIANALLINSTSNGSHIRFTGDPTVGGPVDGDLWYTGTALNFYDGSTTYNLLIPTVTLDSAYNGGNTIDVDGSPVTLTVSDTDNNKALDVVQNDTTNNPDAMEVTNTGTGAALKLTGAGSSLYIQEKAAATGDTAGYGQIWVKTATPNELWFTDDAGTDFQLGVSGSALVRGTFTNATLSSGILTITHNAGLSAPYTVLVTIFDNNSKQIMPDEITGSTNSVAVDLSSYVTAGGGAISGTWGYGYIA